MRKGGWGPVYQDVTRNKNLSAAAKGLYAYLSAFCGISDECYPSVETITEEMSMGKDTFYRHINALVAAGVVDKCEAVGSDGKFGRVLYRLTHNVAVSEKCNFPYPDFPDTGKPDTDDKETKNNNLKNNNFKNNNCYVCPESESSTPDYSGILLPLVDKSEYNVPLAKIEQWQQAFPAVNVEQELQKMIAWLNANPARRKSRKGIERFIVSWLTRSQDNGGSYRQHASSSSHVGTGFSNFEQRDYDFDLLEQQLLDAQE